MLAFRGVHFRRPARSFRDLQRLCVSCGPGCVFWEGVQKEAYELWDQIEQESGVKLYTKTGGMDVLQRGSPQLSAVVGHLNKHKVH